MIKSIDQSLARSHSNSAVLFTMTAVFFGSIITLATQAQTIANADLANGRSGWGETAMVLPYSAFEGADPDPVAVVDGGAVAHRLSQRITGLKAGVTYELAFDATRWVPDTETGEVSATVYVDGVICCEVKRSSRADLASEHIRFTATSDHADLRIEPKDTGGGALLIDDFTLASVDKLPGTLARRDHDVQLAIDGDNDRVRVACATAGMLRVLDHDGRVVRVVNAREGQQVIDIAALPNGRYHVQNAESGAILGRFVKL